MKAKTFLILGTLVALVVPAVSFGSGPTGQDRLNGARDCRAIRGRIGTELFRETYGTARSNRRNAFGRCVSQWAHTEHQNRISARSACATEQADPNFSAAHDGKSFDEYYGTGPQHRNAFGKCVSSKAKAATDEAEGKTANAAMQCKAERSRLGGAEFRTKYGRNASDRNAFGKCVSQLAKAPNA